MYNYILNFLQNRTFQVRVGDNLSERKTQVNGVPQGAVISPILFNVLINGISKTEKKFKNVELGQFADDSGLWTKSNKFQHKTKNHKKKIENIENAANLVIKKLKELGFKVNVNKTQVIFFGTDEEITVNLDGQIVKSQPTAKYLGVTFDKFLKFKDHINDVRKKGERALGLLKATAGRKWGLRTKDKILLYKNFIRPKFLYACEIWDQGDKASLEKLDKIQNKALRIITNTPNSTSIDGKPGRRNIQR